MLSCSEIAALNKVITELNCNIQNLIVSQNALTEIGGIVAITPLSFNLTTRTVSIQQASGTQPGFLSAADYSDFDSRVVTAQNVGTGAEVFKQKTGTNLELRTVQGTTDEIVVQQTANGIVLSIAPAFSNSISSSLTGNLFS